ncbi:Glycogenin-1 [Hordeum vulgare]|nr:Glycogenin-1 [Hordeum vulgare]
MYVGARSSVEPQLLRLKERLAEMEEEKNKAMAAVATAGGSSPSSSSFSTVTAMRVHDMSLKPPIQIHDLALAYNTSIRLNESKERILVVLHAEDGRLDGVSGLDGALEHLGDLAHGGAHVGAVLEAPHGRLNHALDGGDAVGVVVDGEEDATILHSAREYVLESAGWKVKIIERIRNPKAERDAYNEWNYNKFRLWQLTDYDKIIFIDADLLILRNIDFLFTMPKISGTGNNATPFNSGVMVIEPSNCTFQLLMEHINEITSYNGGDQGYLNEIFTWRHRIPKHMNFLKHFWEGDEEEVKAKKTQLFGANPPILYVLHYLGRKPWLCFRDHDCNWNVPILREFASDIAHTRWWKVHDKMPKKLQSYCMLRSRLKAGLEWERR